MKELDRQQAILSDMTMYLLRIEPVVFQDSTVRELTNGFFDEQDKLAAEEKTFELIGEPHEVHK